MTTQDSYPEHSDVDTSVVVDPHASETIAPSPSSTIAASPGEEARVEATTADIQSAGGQIPEATSVTETKEESITTPEHIEPTELTELTAQHDTTSNVDATNEVAVKPFTSFIEEFRQAEARFSLAVQEAREAQTDIASTNPPASSTPFTSVEETFVPEFTMPWETPQFVATPTNEPAEETTLTTEPTASVLTPETATPPAEITGPTEATEATTPPTRPVSPLLRPARLRVPRHNTRRREEVSTPATSVAGQHEPQAMPQGTQGAPEAQSEPVVKAEETAPDVEQSRPTRRYRFDRPAKTTPTVAQTTTPVHADNGPTNGHTQAAQATQTVERETSQQVKPTPTIAQQPEQNVAQQTPAPEPIVAENTAAAQPLTGSERRRKHGQERQRGKEQTQQQPQTQPADVTDMATTLNAQQVIPAAVEPITAQKDEAEPEDLPPLEYAELQRANTRRRRRRHVNGASVATLTGNTPSAAPTKPVVVTPEIPATPPQSAQSRSVAPQSIAPQPVTPQRPGGPQHPAVTTPPAVATNPASYTITSGYTVSQMNQGNDNVGPFMGPDPSPARGTMAAQNVRSIHNNAQRTPVYPVRSTEVTSASVNQLANIVAQAIQTQTDRMVAELRRANQAPTNISVSMPPFPSNERVGVFVDVANLLYSARTLRMAVDFGKLLDFLRGNRRLIRAQAYCPTSPQAGDEQMFLQAVKGLGYRITTKNYKTFASGAKKADLDLDLCMDVVRLVDGRAVDCIVLVSGDSDFMPMLDYCSDHGVRVEVAAFDEAMSATLRQSCDLFINLSMLDEIRA